MAAKTKLLTNSELAAFCAQVSMILRSGIPMAEGLGVMKDDQKNSGDREIIEEILAVVEEGGTFYDALLQTGIFPKYVLDMTAIGETAGKLDDVMGSLSDYYEREESIARGIRDAVAYPLVMVAMMAVVIGVLAAKVLPIFQQVFRQLGGEMSGFSQAVMNFGGVLSRYSAALVVILVILAAAFLVLRGTAWGRRMLENMTSRLFSGGKLQSGIASGRFASAMALMLSSGLDTDRSLEMVYNLVDNKAVREKIDSCRELMEQGMSFADALAGASIFSGVYARLVTVGFRTGAADDVMRKLALRYEQEVDARIGAIVSVLEPTLVAVLSIIVGMILLSVMLPLLGIMSSIG